MIRKGVMKCATLGRFATDLNCEIYQVPAGKRFFLTQIHVCGGGSSNLDVRFSTIDAEQNMFFPGSGLGNNQLAMNFPEIELAPLSSVSMEISTSGESTSNAWVAVCGYEVSP